MLRYLLPLVIFCILALFLYVGLSLNPRDLGSTRLDKPVPLFTLPQLENPTKTFSQQVLVGKVSLFNVWASWCTTCHEEHPLLMQLSKHVAVYGLNYKDKLADAQNMLAQRGNPYLASGFDEKGTVGIEWGLTGTPETFVIDKQGIVRYKHTGPLTIEIIQNVILPLIRQLQNS